MCGHDWRVIGSSKVCVRCGLTVLPTGRIFIDKKLVNYLQERRKKK